MFTIRSIRLKELLVHKMTGRGWKFESFPDKNRVKLSENSSKKERVGISTNSLNEQDREGGHFLTNLEKKMNTDPESGE